MLLILQVHSILDVSAFVRDTAGLLTGVGDLAQYVVLIKHSLALHVILLGYSVNVTEVCKCITTFFALMYLRVNESE